MNKTSRFYFDRILFLLSLPQDNKYIYLLLPNKRRANPVIVNNRNLKQKIKLNMLFSNVRYKDLYDIDRLGKKILPFYNSCSNCTTHVLSF
jgi:hypothetical protein